MRKILLLLVGVMLSAGMSAGCGGQAVVGAAVGGGIGQPLGVGYFYDYLSPFGTWVELAPYGYVWQPAGVGFGWHPYTYGSWLWTDDGWFWDSLFDWGWVPFHYGRWGWDPDIDWYWVPGDVWGPAWVTWAWGGPYVGWAPLPPGAGFELGIGVIGLGEIPDRYWCFVQGNRFLDRDLDRLILPFERNRNILGRLTERGNVRMEGGRVFDGGLGVERARELTNRRISAYRLERSDRPGRAEVGPNAVRVYRPEVQRAPNARPQNVTPRQEAARRRAERQMGKVPGRAERGIVRNFDQMLRQRQDHESRTMRQSQEEERQALRRQQRQQASRAANRAERNRINREFEQRAQQIRQRQQEETNRMNERHRQERQQADRTRNSGGRRRIS